MEARWLVVDGLRQPKQVASSVGTLGTSGGGREAPLLVTASISAGGLFSFICPRFWLEFPASCPLGLDSKMCRGSSQLLR